MQTFMKFVEEARTGGLVKVNTRDEIIADFDARLSKIKVNGGAERSLNERLAVDTLIAILSLIISKQSDDIREYFSITEHFKTKALFDDVDYLIRLEQESPEQADFLLDHLTEPMVLDLDVVLRYKGKLLIPFEVKKYVEITMFRRYTEQAQALKKIYPNAESVLFTLECSIADTDYHLETGKYLGSVATHMAAAQANIIPRVITMLNGKRRQDRKISVFPKSITTPRLNYAIDTITNLIERKLGERKVVKRSLLELY